MSTDSKLAPNGGPLPQVGALLNYNSYLPEEDPGRFFGSRHWDLEGGAILVAPDRMLTVRHAIQKTLITEQAVFVPGHGIFSVKREEPVQEHDRASTDLDWLVLVRLDRPVEGLAPLPFGYVSRRAAGMQTLALYGWGGWRIGVDKSGPLADGIQRSYRVQPLDPNTHSYHNLDLIWRSPKVESPFALRNNSGGAIFGRNDEGREVLVGVIRSADDDVQRASRIGVNRNHWLHSEIVPASLPSVTAAPLGFHCEQHRIDLANRRSLTVALPVLDTSRKVRATLSATPGLLLQMQVADHGWDDASLERLAQDHHAAGRFLYREHDLPSDQDGSGQAHVGVTVLEDGPEPRDHVEVQICATFYG